MSALIKTFDVVIADGASQSGAVALGAAIPIGIEMSAAWTEADVTVLASIDDTSFNPVFDDAGNELTIAVGGGARYIALDQTYFVGFASIKLRSGTAGSPVAQGAARTLKLVTKAS